MELENHSDYCLKCWLIGLWKIWQNYWKYNFKPILQSGGLGTHCKQVSDECHRTSLMRSTNEVTNEKSTLVLVMAWCHQATSHYQSQYWPRSELPYGINRPQWVNFSMLNSSAACPHWTWCLKSQRNYPNVAIFSGHQRRLSLKCE